MQDGDKEFGEWELFNLHLSPPSTVGHNSSAGLVVLIPFAEFEIATILEAQILPASRYDRVDAGEMEAAGCGAMHCKRVVEDVSLPVGLFRVLQLLNETTKFCCLVAVVGSEIFPALGFFDFVR